MNAIKNRATYSAIAIFNDDKAASESDRDDRIYFKTYNRTYNTPYVVVLCSKFN